MKLRENQTDEASLTLIGAKAVKLLQTGDIATLVEHFGYAVALGRELSNAVEADLSACLKELRSTRLLKATPDALTVKHFAPNENGLFALIECSVPTDTSSSVLVELVVTSKDEEKYVTLEQISAAP